MDTVDTFTITEHSTIHLGLGKRDEVLGKDLRNGESLLLRHAKADREDTSS
jgi:hypothetical protein